MSGLLSLSDDEKPNTSQLWRLYWSNHQHFFRHICVSAKVPAVVGLTKQALMDDKCVVIGLQSTGEARTEEAVSKYGAELDDFIFGPRELLLKFVEENYPLPDIPESSFLQRKRHSDVSLRGRVRKVAKVYGQSEIPEEDVTEETVAEVRKRHEEGVARKLKILEKIRCLDLPNNPIDDIIDQLGGHDNVAEITGRRGVLIRASGKKGVTYQARYTKDVAMEMVNMHEKKLFMDGKKLVAIISEAGSAGVSLQADRRAVNQKRRVHLTLELPWSADRAIQQFGRTHRSNQASAPEYRMLITNLGGERRFASIIAKRLGSLGALTQGDRRAGGGPSLSAFNYDSDTGKRALVMMYEWIMEPDKLPVVPPGCSPDEPDTIDEFVMQAKAALISVGITGKSKMDEEVARFLNRLLGLPPEMQNRLFELFVRLFDHVTETARAEGNLDSGIVDIIGDRVELNEKPKTVHVDSMSGVSTQLFTFTLDKGITWEAAYELLMGERLNGDDDIGFYQCRSECLGRTDILLALNGPSPNFFEIFRPAGKASRKLSAVELKHKYYKVSTLQTARGFWEHEYDVSSKQCIHGPKCKSADFCEAIRSREEVNVLSGLILPVWGTVEKALSKQGREIHRQIKVVRIQATSGMSQPIVGLLIPNAAVQTLLQYLACIGPRCYSVLNEEYFSQLR